MNKLYIGTPSHGLQVHIAYHWSVLKLYESPPPDTTLVLPRTVYDNDLVRTRSRILRDFLLSDATHLLFIDSDIEFAPECVHGMLALNKDCISAPYRKKWSHKVEFTIGFGMTLLSRNCVQQMTDVYRKILTRPDTSGVNLEEGLVMLCMLVDDGKQLASEDFSFFRRYQNIGGQPMLYKGTGAPVGHWGSFKYEGELAENLTLPTVGEVNVKDEEGEGA